MKKLVALFLAMILVIGAAACTGTNNNSSAAPTESSKAAEASTAEASTPAESSAEETPEVKPIWSNEFDVMTLGNYEYGTDYVSLYDKYGADITIADVTEEEVMRRIERTIDAMIEEGEIVL